MSSRFLWFENIQLQQDLCNLVQQSYSQDYLCNVRRKFTLHSLWTKAQFILYLYYRGSIVDCLFSLPGIQTIWVSVAQHLQSSWIICLEFLPFVQDIVLWTCNKLWYVGSFLGVSHESCSNPLNRPPISLPYKAIGKTMLSNIFVNVEYF